MKNARSSGTGPGAGRRQHATSRRERTRRRIFDAAFRLIGNERGRSVRIEEICALAQISRGSFYNYFAGIDALFEALAYDLSHDFIDAVITEMARMKSAAEQADAGMRYFLDRARADPQWGWAMVNIGATGPLFGAETLAAALATIESGIARGEFLLTDAKVGRDLTLGACHAAIITHLREGSRADQPQCVSRSVLRGLGVAAAKRESIVSRQLPSLPRSASLTVKE
jgi:AcrR family transcriptional regulator